MDRREAIEILRNRRTCALYDSDAEALDLAIEALKKVSVYEQVRWERDWALKTLDEHGIGLGQIAEETSTTTDCISRQAAIEAVEKQYFGGTVADINPSWRKLHNILESLPPVNQKQITGKLESVEIATSEGEESTMNQPKSKLDCISRQEVLDLVSYWLSGDEGGDILERIDNLPPVTPTERTGVWIEKRRVAMYIADLQLSTNTYTEIGQAQYKILETAFQGIMGMGGDTE